MTAFAEWVRQYPDTDATRLARRCVREEPALAVEAIADRIEWLRRGEVRSQERENFTEMMETAARTRRTPARGEQSEQTEEQNAMYALLQERFALGDGTKVTWGQATVEQHEQRIALLEAMVRGTQETIDRHRTAVRRLRSAGARCLDDLVGATA